MREKVLSTYFQRTPENKVTANAVLLDMEPKVVQQCLHNHDQSKSGHWAYDPSLAYFKQGGSGNNWALGYQYLGPNEYLEVSSRV